jgi:hypothetical protein
MCRIGKYIPDVSGQREEGIYLICGERQIKYKERRG